MTYAEATKIAKHPVSCIDCHDPKTMALRIDPPRVSRGDPQLQGFQQGVKDYDPNTMASAAEMFRLRPMPCGVLLQG